MSVVETATGALVEPIGGIKVYRYVVANRSGRRTEVEVGLVGLQGHSD